MIWIILGILTIIFLIGFSAFFSSAEMAFISISRAMIREKARAGDKHAKILDKLLRKPDNVISAIVIGNNLVNIFASIVAGAIATIVFGNIGIGIATVVMVMTVIIFCEVAPKSFGMHNEKLALKVARPLLFVTTLFHPFVVLVTGISNGLIRLSGGKKTVKGSINEERIMALMRLGEEEGTIESDELEMVDDVFEFDETIADEVDQPKHKVEFIHINDTVGSLIKKSIKTGYSRFPVYRKNHDDIVGMVHVKDTLIIKDESVPVKNIMRKILKIKANMKVDDVSREMKKHKTHIALLQDKKGKTLGLVSMEDLIEEIFGEISDEHDVKT